MAAALWQAVPHEGARWHRCDTQRTSPSQKLLGVQSLVVEHVLMGVHPVILNEATRVA
jgi:hypothetical protein